MEMELMTVYYTISENVVSLLLLQDHHLSHHVMMIQQVPSANALVIQTLKSVSAT
jgi:hypothetical protein